METLVYTYRFRFILLGLSFVTIFSKAQGIIPLNILTPYDIRLYMPAAEDVQIQCTLEHGFRADAFDTDGHTVPLFELWQPTQSFLAAVLANPDVLDHFSDALKTITDDGLRGHATLTGSLQYDAALLAARIKLPYCWWFNIFVPIYHLARRGDFTAVPPGHSADDELVYNLLMTDIPETLNLLGLSTCSFSHTNIGDCAFSFEWMENYPQRKPWLKNVWLDMRLGFTIPTAKKIDPVDIFALPLGNNGSTGLFFAGSVKVTLLHVGIFGADAEFLHLFNNSEQYRIKTTRDETDFLFSAVTNILYAWGTTQRFTLSYQTSSWDGMSIYTAYQVIKHGEDTIYLDNNSYSQAIANTAQSIQDWTIHEWWVSLFIDSSWLLPADSPCVPIVQLYARIPFNGHNSMAINSAGISIGLDF